MDPGIGERFVRYRTESGSFGFMQIEIDRCDPLSLEGWPVVNSAFNGTMEDWEELSLKLRDGSLGPKAADVTVDNVLTFSHPMVKIYNVALNSHLHAVNCGFRQPSATGVTGEPSIFATNALVTTFGDEVIAMRDPGQHDPEVELVGVFDRTGRNVPAEKAFEYVKIFGVGVDGADRGVQLVDVFQGLYGIERILGNDGKPRIPQFLMGKSGDGYAHTSPIFGFVDHPYNLGLELDVRGREQQRLENIGSDMLWKIPAVVAHLTNGKTVRAGDLIFFGSTSGVEVEKPLGKREEADYIVAGDQVLARIPGLAEVSYTLMPSDHQPVYKKLL